MSRSSLLCTTLSFLHLFTTPTALAQTCSAAGTDCDTFQNTLEEATSQYSQNVFNPGGEFQNPEGTIDDVCNIGGPDLQTCYVCNGAGSSGQLAEIIDAWWETCDMFQQDGQDAASAYQCWLSIPDGSGSCSSKASSGGGGGGGTPAQTPAATPASQPYTTPSQTPATHSSGGSGSSEGSGSSTQQSKAPMALKSSSGVLGVAAIALFLLFSF